MSSITGSFVGNFLDHLRDWFILSVLFLSTRVLYGPCIYFLFEFMLSLTVAVESGCSYLLWSFLIFQHLYDMVWLQNITKITANAFNSTRLISSLDLSNCGLVEFPAEALKKLQNLTTLNLDSNNISEIRKEHFSEMKGLKVLSIANNQILQILDDTFSSLKSLSNLNISGSPIKSIGRGAFRGLGLLLTLAMNNLAISDIPEEAFQSLVGVLEVYLSGNPRLRRYPNLYRLSRLIKVTLDPRLNLNCSVGERELVVVEKGTVVQCIPPVITYQYVSAFGSDELSGEEIRLV